jgi:putative transposase
MNLVERHIIRDSAVLEDLCFKSARLYNFINYHKRQAFFGKQEDFNEYDMNKILAEYNQEDYRKLPASTSQQVCKQVFKAWKGYWAALKEFKKHPEKFMARPKPPKYKHKEGYNIVSFSYQQCKVKDGYIVFPKAVNIPNLKTRVTNLKQVRIVPQATCFVIEVVYNQEIQTHENIKPKNILSIDLGLTNVITAINNVGEKPFIVNGGMLKSINNYYNKKRAKLQSYIGDKGTSNRINRLTYKRNNKINDALHKLSKFILEYCLKHGIGTVVVGKNEHWKRNINLGKKTNQNFVSIPHAKLIEMIAYKLELHSIKTIVQEEAHTSKVDHLAYESIEHHDKYKGSRRKRGLFVSSTGKLMNADVNGAIGIALKSKVVRKGFVKSLLNTGLAQRPVKLNLINNPLKMAEILSFKG